MKFEEALDKVACELFVRWQPKIVNVRELIRILVKRRYYPCEFLAPERPHALITQTADVAGSIQVTIAKFYNKKRDQH